MPIMLREVLNERLDEFERVYSFHEQDEALRALAVVGEMLDLIFDGPEARLAMTALRRIVIDGCDWKSDWDWSKVALADIGPDWRTAWNDLDGWVDSSQPIFFDELHDLSAFAKFGIVPVWSYAGKEILELPQGARSLRDRIRAVKELPAWVESVCIKIDHLERLAPRPEQGQRGLSQILDTRDLARARVKFDQGQPLTIRDLAFLSGVTIKRVQNAIYAKTDEAPVVDKNGLITPEAAQPWLSARDYKPSIWKQVTALYPLKEGWGINVPFEEPAINITAEDYVFVPVANDGSMFVPDLIRGEKSGAGSYMIGPKGGEHAIPRYRDALDELAKMEVPRWRRPNPESGNWGIVTGQSWRRVRLSDIDGLSS